MTPLKQPQYGRVKLTDIPVKIIEEYKLHEKATADGWVYFKVVQGSAAYLNQAQTATMNSKGI